MRTLTALAAAGHGLTLLPDSAATGVPGAVAVPHAPARRAPDGTGVRGPTRRGGGDAGGGAGRTRVTSRSSSRGPWLPALDHGSVSLVRGSSWAGLRVELQPEAIHGTDCVASQADARPEARRRHQARRPAPARRAASWPTAQGPAVRPVRRGRPGAVRGRSRHGRRHGDRHEQTRRPATPDADPGRPRGHGAPQSLDAAHDPGLDRAPVPGTPPRRSAWRPSTPRRPAPCSSASTSPARATRRAWSAATCSWRSARPVSARPPTSHALSPTPAPVSR